jgi:hypothetical protein
MLPDRSGDRECYGVCLLGIDCVTHCRGNVRHGNRCFPRDLAWPDFRSRGGAQEGWALGRGPFWNGVKTMARSSFDGPVGLRQRTSIRRGSRTHRRKRELSLN